jgi:hypothetical protein
MAISDNSNRVLPLATDNERMLQHVLDNRIHDMTTHFFQTAVFCLLGKLLKGEDTKKLLDTWRKGIENRAKDEIDENIEPQFVAIFGQKKLVEVEMAAIASVYSTMHSTLIGPETDD